MHKGSKVIIVVVQVGAVKIYVKQHWRCSGKKRKRGSKKLDETSFPTKILVHFFLSFTPPLTWDTTLFAFSALKARQDKRSIFLPPPHHKVKRRNMFLLLHFYSLLTEMMFSSLFQHFGKGKRERERLVHFQMTISPQFMSSKKRSTFNKARKAPWA